MKISNIPLFLLALTTPAGASAADPLPKAVADLQCLVGEWSGAGSVAMGGETAPIKASWSCKRTSAKFGVLCSFRVTGIPGVAVFEETDLMGYEPNTQTFHWYAVTNAGETHDHVAVAGPGALEFVSAGSQAGKPLKEVIRLDFAPDSKRVQRRAQTFLAGESVSTMQLDLHK